MKRVLIGAILSFSLAYAQTNMQGGVELKTTQINSTSAKLIGGGGGITYKNGVFIGGAGYGLLNRDIKANGVYNNKNLSLGYGGMLIGYHAGADNLISLNTTLLLGGGGISAGTDDGDTSAGGFVTEAGFTIYLNLTKYIGIQSGVSYRYFDNTDVGGLSKNNINGISYNIGLNFHPYQ